MTQSPINKGVFFHYGSHWKRIRSILTPTFSTGKLKLVRSQEQDFFYFYFFTLTLKSIKKHRHLIDIQKSIICFYSKIIPCTIIIMLLFYKYSIYLLYIVVILIIKRNFLMSGVYGQNLLCYDLNNTCTHDKTCYLFP